jgi:ubiquinone/menaquinone biosynthesis C-methylase UbiE
MTGQSHDQRYIPAMGKHWLLALYDPFTRLARVGRVHEQLLDRADVQPGQRVLEIGCGTGNLLTALGQRRLKIEAVGIDPDPAALRRARRKAARRKLPIRYDQAFAGELPLEDDSFDRVLSALMLHHLDDDERLRALREAGRVLRPDGQLHIVDIDGNQSHRHRRVGGSTPEDVVAAMREAGLAEAARNGGATNRFGVFAFYRATKR